MDIKNMRSKRRNTLYPTNLLPKNPNIEIIKHFNPTNYLESNESELPEVGLEDDDEREFIETDEVFRPGRQKQPSNATKKSVPVKFSDVNVKTQNILLNKVNPPAKQKNKKPVKPAPQNTVTKKTKPPTVPTFKHTNVSRSNRRTASTDSSSSNQNNDPKPNRPKYCRPVNCKAKKIVNTTLDSIRNKKEIQNCVKSTLKQLGTTKINIKLNTTHNKIFAQKTDAVQCNPRNEAYLICESYVQQLKDEINTAKTDSKGEIYETANQLKNEIAEFVKSKDVNNKFRVVTKAKAEVKVIFRKTRGNSTIESSDMEPSKHEMKNAGTSISWCEYCALSKRYHEMQNKQENLSDEVIRNCDEQLICTHSFEQCENRGITDAVPSLNKTFSKEVPVQDTAEISSNNSCTCHLNDESLNLRMEEMLADKDFEKTSLYGDDALLDKKEESKTKIVKRNQSPNDAASPR